MGRFSIASVTKQQKRKKTIRSIRGERHQGGNARWNRAVLRHSYSVASVNCLRAIPNASLHDCSLILKGRIFHIVNHLEIRGRRLQCSRHVRQRGCGKLVGLPGTWCPAVSWQHSTLEQYGPNDRERLIVRNQVLHCRVAWITGDYRCCYENLYDISRNTSHSFGILRNF